MLGISVSDCFTTLVGRMYLSMQVKRRFGKEVIVSDFEAEFKTASQWWREGLKVGRGEWSLTGVIFVPTEKQNLIRTTRRLPVPIRLYHRKQTYKLNKK